MGTNEDPSDRRWRRRGGGSGRQRLRGDLHTSQCQARGSRAIFQHFQVQKGVTLTVLGNLLGEDITFFKALSWRSLRRNISDKVAGRPPIPSPLLIRTPRKKWAKNYEPMRRYYEPCGWPKDPAAGLSSGGLTLTAQARCSRRYRPVRIRMALLVHRSLAD
jgi:hypothetical protein